MIWRWSLVAILLMVSCSPSRGTTGTSSDAANVAPDVPKADNSIPPADLRQSEELPGKDTAADVEETDTDVTKQCQPGIVEWPVPGAADETFEIGPYLMDSRPESIIIAWRTVDTVVGKVNFGPDDTLSGEASDNEAKRYHQILLEGLTPGTRYAYQVSTPEKTSSVHHFVTPVAGQPTRFVVWGDNQSGWDNFTQLQPLMEARAPHALLGVGDHISKGKVEELWLQELFGPARALLHDVPLFAAIGNHEENASFWYDFFAYPEGEVPEDENSEAYYSFTFGNVFFLIINTNTVFFPIGDVDTPVSEWIREQVTSPAAQNATWRIAYGHEPGITENWSPDNCKYDGYKPVRNWFLPFIAEHGFHLYMAGHTHSYERALMDTGLVQIITGGGGGHLDEWCKDFPETTAVYQNHHFLVIEADCDRLRIEVEAIDGKIVDWLELDANQPGVLVEQGPAEGLPELIINSESPTRKAE